LKSQYSALGDYNQQDSMQQEIEQRGQANQSRYYDPADLVRDDDLVRDGLSFNYTAALNGPLREWSAGGDFGEGSPGQSSDRNRPYVRRSEDNLSDLGVALV
jgi:hypothetical protein